VGVEGQLAGNDLGEGHYGGEDDENDGDSFHGGAEPVVDAAVDGGVDVVDGVGACADCGPPGVPCGPHDSPGDAHYGGGAQGQGEPWGQAHQHSQLHPEHDHTDQDQGA